MSKFTAFKEVDQVERIYTKWNPEESTKELVGTFAGIKTIKFQDSSFDVIQFTDCKTYPAMRELGNIDFPSYAMLKRKVEGKEGRKLGIEYIGKEKDSKNPAKSIHKFAVYDMESSSEDNNPF